MKSDGKVVIETTLDNTGFKKGIKGLPSQLGGLKSALTKFSRAAAAAVGIKALVDLGKQAVSLGSDIEEVQNVVDTAFGDMAYKIEEFADRAIEGFGMSKLSAKQTASTYMAMAKGMGIAAGKASDMAIALTGLTGDVASFYNLTQQEADTKLKSIFTGETETLKSLGVVMTQTNLDAFAMAKGFGKTTKAMTQAELVALRYAYVTDKLGIAAGDFAKTSNSWANQTRILSEKWKEFLSIMGQGLINALTPAVKLLNRMMDALILFAEKFADLMENIFGKSEKSAKAQTDALEGIAAAEEDVAAATDAATAAMKRQTAGFDEMNILASNSGTSAAGGTGAGGNSAVNTPITPNVNPKPTVSAISKIKKAMDDLSDYFAKKYAPSVDAWGDTFDKIKEKAPAVLDNVSEKTTKMWQDSLKPVGEYIANEWAPKITNSFSENIAPVLGDTIPFMLDELGKDYGFMCDLIDRYTEDIFVPNMELAGKVATDAMDEIGKTWEKRGDDLLEAAEKIRQGLRETWEYLYEQLIAPIAKNIAETVGWLWDKHLKKLWGNMMDFFGSLGEAIAAIWNGLLKPLVDFIVAVLAPVITAAIQIVIDVLASVIAWVSDMFSALFKSLSGILDFITGVFTGDWEKAWNGLKNTVGYVFDAIWGTIKFVINLIIDAFNALWRLIYAAIAGVINGIGSIAKSIGKLIGQDWGWKVPTNPPVIPKLAQGAVIPANQSFLAVLGDQKAGRNLEAPESLIRQIVREESGSGSGPITVILKVGTHILGKVVLESINELTRQNGQLSLALE